MAKYGFLGSAFDPITTGHMVTLQEMLTRKGFDKIFLLPSSQLRPDKDMNVSDEDRLNMIKLAIAGNDKLDIETYEMSVPAHRVHTYQTMEALKKMEKYKGHDLYFLMGADLLVDIANGTNWTFREQLLKDNRFVVIRRNGIDMHEVISGNRLLRKYEDHFDFIYRGVDNNISSSYIREEFEDGRDPRYYMLPAVYDYIVQHNLYRKKN